MPKKNTQKEQMPKVYRNVTIFVPDFKFLPPEAAKHEPWKLPVPVFMLGDQAFTITCKEYTYFMTDDSTALAEELAKYKLLVPPAKKYSPNPSLNHAVRLKMLELGAKWSLIDHDDTVIINYYTEKEGAFIAIADKDKIR